MSASGGTRAVIAALLANLGIALTKFVAFAAHRVLVDAGRGDPLGGRLGQSGVAAGRRQAGAARGHAATPVRVRPGALHLRVHRVHRAVQRRRSVRVVRRHPQAPAPGSRSTSGSGCRSPCWSIALALESMSFRTAIDEANHVRTEASWRDFIRHARAPELPVVLLEDFAALIGLVFALFGVGLTLITGNGIWDGIGTVCIGALLVCVAVVLAMETKSLLLGESATPENERQIERGASRHARRRPDHPHEDDAPRPRGGAGRCQGRDVAEPRDGRGLPGHRRRRGASPRPWCRSPG